MRRKFSRSWELVKASWAVLVSDRSLLIYPIVSGIAVTVLALLIAGPLFAFGLLGDSENASFGVAQIIGLFVLYFVCYLAVFFCNTAMVFVVMRRLNGDQTPITGWTFARSRIAAIAGYAAIAATVGVALQVVSSKSETAGKILASLGGAAWSIATFLAIPVLVVEQVGPIDTIRRSAGLLRKTWGEQIIGNAGIGLVTGVLTVAVLLVFGGVLLLAIATGFTLLIVLAALIGVLALAAVAVVSAALDAIYRAALYRYAEDGDTRNFPAAALLPDAFAPKS